MKAALAHGNPPPLVDDGGPPLTRIFAVKTVSNRIALHCLNHWQAAGGILLPSCTPAASLTKSC